ncbi:MAG: zinc-binding dehydrogenase [Rubrobacter sp.]|nr:zinc-binding dehydrogenase [Rubrobacter sp.]
MRAIVVRETGGPEVLGLEDMPVPDPGEGEVLIRVVAAGVNYADAGLRAGMAGGPHAVKLPYTPGFEAAGTVAAVGPGVTGLAPGRRVAAVLESGGYAEYALAPAAALVEVPEGMDFDTATAALLVQGITAYGVLHDAAGLRAGESVLVQAAAGGVGSLAVQLAGLAGAHPVIGTASTPEKRQRLSELGVDHAIDYTEDEWPSRVLEVTGGRGADVVLESVGGAAGARAYECLAPLGHLVTFGAASGEGTPPPDMLALNFKGQTITGYGGPWIRPGRAAVAREEISLHLEQGRLEAGAGHSLPLAAAPEAHRALQSRSTVGKVVLCP